MKHDWNDGTKKRWSRLFVYSNCASFLPRNLHVRFRNLYFMNLILKTKYTLSIEFVLAKYAATTIGAWPDFDGRCGEVRTSPEIVLNLP